MKDNLFCIFTVQKRAKNSITTDYESVYGIGKAEILKDDAARLHGLKVLMAHYTEETFADDSFLPRPLALAEVVKISVREWTCKRLVRD